MVRLIKASGTLARMLSNIDDVEMAKVSNKMMIAAKIGNALRNKNMTQKAFAAKMGKPQSEISEWLSGDRNFTIDTLTEISKALDIVLINILQTNCSSIPKSNLVEKRGMSGNSEILQEVFKISFTTKGHCPVGKIKVA